MKLTFSTIQSFKQWICTALLMLCTHLIFAQNEQQKIQMMFDSISDCRVDSLKMAIHQRLYIRIGNLLESDSSFEASFDELKNLGKVYSDDGIVRVYTWSFPLEDKSFQYGGFIQYKNKNTIATTPLIIPNEPYCPEINKRIDANHWYGSLYYKIVKVKKRRETYYLALGWSGYNAATDFKVIEPMNFDKNGKLTTLGKAVFKVNAKQPPLRTVLEYNSDGKVTLDYHSENQQIIFDHLMPIEPIYEGIRSYYGPDFTYDAFSLKKGEWYFIENIDARNR